MSLITSSVIARGRAAPNAARASRGGTTSASSRTETGSAERSGSSSARPSPRTCPHSWVPVTVAKGSGFGITESYSEICWFYDLDAVPSMPEGPIAVNVFARIHDATPSTPSAGACDWRARRGSRSPARCGRSPEDPKPWDLGGFSEERMMGSNPRPSAWQAARSRHPVPPHSAKAPSEQGNGPRPVFSDGTVAARPQALRSFWARRGLERPCDTCRVGA
jgi:hypothetical protein